MYKQDNQKLFANHFNHSQHNKISQYLNNDRTFESNKKIQKPKSINQQLYNVHFHPSLKYQQSRFHSTEFSSHTHKNEDQNLQKLINRNNQNHKLHNQRDAVNNFKRFDQIKRGTINHLRTSISNKKLNNQTETDSISLNHRLDFINKQQQEKQLIQIQKLNDHGFKTYPKLINQKSQMVNTNPQDLNRISEKQSILRKTLKMKILIENIKNNHHSFEIQKTQRKYLQSITPREKQIHSQPQFLNSNPVPKTSSRAEIHKMIKQNSVKLQMKEKYVNNKFKEAKIEDFILLSKRGSGRYGVVYCVIHKYTNTIYAIKKVHKSLVKNMQAQFISQVKIQYYLNDSNILKLFGIFDDKQFIYLLLEYMEEGTLFEYIKNKEHKLSQKQIFTIINQMTKAIKYLHHQNVIHRDIKPENILISYGVYKLSDFGWAIHSENKRTTFCGTLDYSPPQMFQGKQYDECVDLWCLGILTYELLTGLPPFYNQSKKETINLILNMDKKQLKFPQGTSWALRDFIECLLKKDPAQRKSALQLFYHPFIIKYEDESQSL